MGSPYFVHKQVNRIHVVRTSRGFERILEVIARSMGRDLSTVKVDRYSPEWVVYDNLRSAFDEASGTKSRVAVFLEARYEWRGWEKFQRVVIFDFSGKEKDGKRVVEPNFSDTLSEEAAKHLFPGEWLDVKYDFR